jgi:hypothetical protein
VKRFGVTILGITLAVLLLMDPARGEETSVSILSPPEGGVVDSQDVRIDLKFVKGEKGDHLHFYVDGQFFKTSRRESVVVWGLPSGDHRIEVRVASREKDERGVEHKEIGPKASVTIQVQSPVEGSGERRVIKR